MRAVIVGYGSMGREVERALAERGHTVTARVDTTPGRGDARELTEEIAAKADVAIEFSTAEAVVGNTRRYAALGLSAVVGTTGWAAKLDEVAALVGTSSIGYLHGSNFSLAQAWFSGALFMRFETICYPFTFREKRLPIRLTDSNTPFFKSAWPITAT